MVVFTKFVIQVHVPCIIDSSAGKLDSVHYGVVTGAAAHDILEETPIRSVSVFMRSVHDSLE